MDYSLILDIATEVAYQLALGGAETFRVEESVSRILAAYGATSEVFAIPNNLTVTMTTPEGEIITRIRRIGFHGNDMDSVERFSNLSRLICTTKPEPTIAAQWVKEARDTAQKYTLPLFFWGNILSGFGFSLFFGGSFFDALAAGFCALLIGLVNHYMGLLKVNPFFTTIAASFMMAFAAYAIGALDIGCNPDLISIGALMVLVPGLLFTNAMRDIIFGDTNSGINRIVQVFLIAAAIALGTGTAWNIGSRIWGKYSAAAAINYPLYFQCMVCAVGSLGVALLFNIRGKGILLCLVGASLSWAAYYITFALTNVPNLGYFLAALLAAAYSEAMARIRHFPAISYLVVAIFPLIPGAGIYYTACCLAENDMAGFATKGTATVACAGVIAVGILIISTIVRSAAMWKQLKK